MNRISVNLSNIPRTIVSPYTTYTDTLPLPDGRTLPMACTNNPPNYTWCNVTFPNGQEFDAPYSKSWDSHDWSPDKRYVVRCAGSTHDSSCLDGVQVWDMVAGEKIGGISIIAVYQWLPDRPHTLAYIEGLDYSRSFKRLVGLDAESRQEVVLSTCPASFLRMAESLAWVAEACHTPSRSPLVTPTP